MKGEVIIGLLIATIEVEIIGLSGSSERLVVHVWLPAHDLLVVLLLILLLLVMLLVLHVILCLLVLVVCARLVI